MRLSIWEHNGRCRVSREMSERATSPVPYITKYIRLFCFTRTREINFSNDKLSQHKPMNHLLCGFIYLLHYAYFLLQICAFICHALLMAWVGVPEHFIFLLCVWEQCQIKARDVIAAAMGPRPAAGWGGGDMRRLNLSGIVCQTLIILGSPLYH